MSKSFKERVIEDVYQECKPEIRDTLQINEYGEHLVATFTLNDIYCIELHKYGIEFSLLRYADEGRRYQGWIKEYNNNFRPNPFVRGCSKKEYEKFLSRNTIPWTEYLFNQNISAREVATMIINKGSAFVPYKEL